MDKGRQPLYTALHRRPGRHPYKINGWNVHVKIFIEQEKPPGAEHMSRDGDPKRLE
jgi:hypothetical protein